MGVLTLYTDIASTGDFAALWILSTNELLRMSVFANQDYCCTYKKPLPTLSVESGFCNVSLVGGYATRFFPMLSALYNAMLTGTLAVFLNAAVQYKVSVFQRFVVDQPVQFGAVKAVVCNFVLHDDTINGDYVAVCEKQLHAGSVDIKFIRN